MLQNTERVEHILPRPTFDMAQLTTSLIPNVYTAPPEIWAQIFSLLRLEDLLLLRASGSSHFKALAEDHPTFCNNIHLLASGSTALFHHRCKAGARKGYALRLYISLRFNDWCAFGRVLPSDARSARVAAIVATLCSFSDIVKSLGLNVCSEHFHLLAPYLSLPATKLECFSLDVVDYYSSQLLRRLPDDLFQGNAPGLHEVRLVCVLPSVRPCVSLPSVRLLTATGGAEDEFPLPVGYHGIFPCVERLALGGGAWIDSNNDEISRNFDTISTLSLKHIQLDFEEYGENGRLFQAMSTPNIESIVMGSYSYDDANMRGFLQLLSELCGPTVLTMTVHRAGCVELSFVSGRDSKSLRSRTLEVSLPHDGTTESSNAITIDLFHIFKLLLQASALNVDVTELRIDVAAGAGIISEFTAALPYASALVLIIHPETEPEQDWLAVSDIWSDSTSEADDDMVRIEVQAPVTPDPRLRNVRTVKACLGNGSKAKEVELHETDADTMVSLLRRMPLACASLEMDPAIVLDIQQRQALKDVSS